MKLLLIPSRRNCPLPTSEARLLFIPVRPKTCPLRVAQALMFELPQGKPNRWIYVLLPVLCTTLRQLGDAPVLSLTDLAQRFALPVYGVAACTASLLAMTAPSNASRALKMRIRREGITAARRSAIP